MSTKISTLSTAFLWRRVHSLMGFWLVLFLFEHLTVNSQAALWIGDDGHLFVKFANLLESIPYLQVVEVLLIGVPIALHGGWGIKRALVAKSNSGNSDGSTPSLQYGRNRAYSWQRITSWILLFGIIFHVVDMRFLDYPEKTSNGRLQQYLTVLSFDEGLYSLSDRLRVTLYSSSQIAEMASQNRSNASEPVEKKSLLEAVKETEYDPEKSVEIEEQLLSYEEKKWIEKLASFDLSKTEVIAVCSSPGTAMLLHIRDTFKSPLMVALYTIFVLSAAFHAGNGFWTFLITWGWILSIRSQRAMIPFSILVIGFLSFLGLAAIWGSYWINLRY